ncbi:MAG: ArsB/NhaD family transporter [Candidatus Gastranaerophilales bacterium]|nr:ArsB/NhaD family transporter [Candidatus Gastranaerophilales bacterium]
MGSIYDFIQSNSIAFSAGILILVYFFIATEKISRVTIVLIGATLTMLLGLLSQDKGHHGNFNTDYFINFIDFNVIFLLVSMMIIIHIAAGSGVFNWVANELLRFTKGKPKWVLLTLGIFTAVASAFLDNVTTVILIMPVTFIIAKELDISPIPLLITEILTSNIGGTATLIGDPPNIIIGSAAKLSFLDFVLELSGIVILILTISLFILMFIFRKSLKTTPEKMGRVSNIDNSKTITDFPLMLRSTIVLGIVILGFILHDVIHIQSYLVAMAGAAFLLIFEKPHHILREVEWNTIFFFIGLFIIIGGLEASGGISSMAKWLLDITQGSQSATAMIILWASGILSGIVDNIPYTVTMAPMLVHVQSVMGAEYTHPLWWCLSLGACLGGNMTIIGAAANVIVSETASKAGHSIPFLKFMKYGILITFISLCLSSVYIYFRFLN